MADPRDRDDSFTSEPVMKAGATASDAEPGDSLARRFDIPPGPLDVTLAAFERATGIRIRFANEALKVITRPASRASRTSRRCRSSATSPQR
jgi:hypothetical protein